MREEAVDHSAEPSECRPYSGIRIIDLTRDLGSYCGRLFADLGAEVIRIELPAGRSDRKAPPFAKGADHARYFRFQFDS